MRERVMAVLMVKCPRTGQDMSTGIFTDWAAIRDSGHAGLHRCPHCGLRRDARSGAVESTCCGPRCFRLQMH